MSRQAWNEAVAAATADGTAIANLNTEQLVFPVVRLPANFMADGRSIRLRAYGKLSTTGTPTIIFRVRLGGLAGTLVALAPTLTMGSGVSNVVWSLEVMLQVRTNGASGTVIAFGDVSVNTASTPTVVAASFGVAGYNTPATATVDFTADQDLAITAQWSAASASNTLTGQFWTVEAMN